MTVWNLGSINVDKFYRLSHLPAPGETLAADDYREGLGGKGANMSVAVARAAARVVQIGAVGQDGLWARDRLLEYGVDTRHIAVVDGASGHANINVDAAGENQIILFPGANRLLTIEQIKNALSEAEPGDTLLVQNETNGQSEAVALARSAGLKTMYAAAPFDEAATLAVLDQIDMLVLNDVEARQLMAAVGKDISDMPVPHIVVTRGGDGCSWYDTAASAQTDMPAYKADVVDTTGAGDTFTGFLCAALDRDLPMRQAIDLALRAGALMVSRRGTADVIPDLKDIEGTRFG
jgi:ribokinase